jgi:toxin YoeB
MNMTKIAFEPDAFEQLDYWSKTDRKILKKTFILIKDIQRDPFSSLN